MAYKYFIYSRTQAREREATEKSIGKKFRPGEVAVGAKMAQFTEMNSTGVSRYSDAKIVAEGELSRMNYTPIR